MAVITGGRRGIGLGVAFALADEDHDVVIVDLIDDAATEETVEGVIARGAKCSFLQHDVSDVGGAETLCDETFAARETNLQMSNTVVLDRLAIRDLVENWALWRDAGDWQRFAGVWHDDGVMMATWFQGSANEFIRASQEGWAKGVRILHFLGGTSIDLVGKRAVAQTKMTISQHAEVLCCGLHRPLLRLRREVRRPLGHRAAPAGLREGSDRPD